MRTINRRDSGLPLSAVSKIAVSPAVARSARAGKAVPLWSAATSGILRRAAGPARPGRRGADSVTEGEGAAIGHPCVIHGAVIGAEALVGCGVTVLDGAVVGPRAPVVGGATVPPGITIPVRCSPTGRSTIVPVDRGIGRVALVQRASVHGFTSL